MKYILIAVIFMMAGSTFSIADTNFDDSKAKCQEALNEMTSCVDKTTNTAELKKCKEAMANKMDKLHKNMKSSCKEDCAKIEDCKDPKNCKVTKKTNSKCQDNKCGKGKCGS